MWEQQRRPPTRMERIYLNMRHAFLYVTPVSRSICFAEFGDASWMPYAEPCAKYTRFANTRFS